MITYEYPINEKMRTYLRVERLIDRLTALQAGTSEYDHHFALQTLFELMDMGSRADLRGDLLKDIDRQKGVLAGYANNPNIDESALNGLLKQLDDAYDSLNETTGKLGHSLSESEFLNAIRGRMGIPAGTCEFDLPAYHDWLKQPVDARQKAIAQWMRSIDPIPSVLKLMLGLLRDSAAPHSVVAKDGMYQQNLPQGRNVSLIRIGVPDRAGWVPEVSANRLLISVRIMRIEDGHRTQSMKADVDFLISNCG